MSEAVGVYALKYVKIFPVELSTRFHCCNATVECCSSLGKLAKFTAWEIMLQKNAIREREILNSEIQRNYPKWKKDKILENFLSQVDKTIKDW